MSQNTEVTFYPSVRQGYRPDAAFSADATSVSNAGKTSVTLDISGTGEAGTDTRQASMDLRLYGPGDITNVDHRQIVRTEPEPDTTEFPPNYFPLVEFDRPDLPWLFSPTTADDAGRNRPWLCLVCVPIDDGSVSYKPAGTGPCPVLQAPATMLPDPTESWAWAHAQLLGETTTESAELESRSTKTLSRLVCPINLAANTRYRACVVPTYEPGRRAGLGLDPYPDGRSSVSLAWEGDASIRLPVYFSWQFTTSAAGDFESLARELEPRQLGPNVGYRTVDVSNPGPEELKLAYEESTQTGTVGMGGALRSVGAEPDPYDGAMVDALRDLLNSPGTVLEETDFGALGPPLYGQWHAGIPNLEAEPERYDPERYYYPTWFNELNVDPRHRLAAGFGTLVVQENQDALMSSAWDQFGDVREANRLLRRAKLASAVLEPVHEKLSSYTTTRLLGMTAPVRATLFDEAEAQTVFGTLAKSDVSESVASTAFQRTLRSTGPLARRSGVSLDHGTLASAVESNALPTLGNGLAFDSTTPTTSADADLAGSPTSAGGQPSMIEDGTALDEGMGDDSAVPGAFSPTDADGPAEGAQTPFSANAVGNRPMQPPAPGTDRVRTALSSLESHCLSAEADVTALATAVGRDDADAIDRLLSRPPTVDERVVAISANTFEPLSRALAKFVATGERGDDVPLEAAERQLAMRDLHRESRRVERNVGEATTAVRSGTYEPPAVEQRLEQATAAIDAMLGVVSRLRSTVEQPSRLPAATSTSMHAMSADADGTALDIETATDMLVAPDDRSLEAVDFDSLRTTVMDELEPVPALAEHLGSRLRLPLLGRDDPVEEVLAAPLFDRPLSTRLAAMNQECFLPGAGQIPKNTVGVLETNPEFVEAFMVGANHEMARELRWRKYPTDRKGTYFRRFWDRRGDPEAKTAFESGETDAYDDITQIHTWDENELGVNSPEGTGATVVLLVKGELLRRYPNTDVFAAKAVADDPEDGSEADRVPALPNTHVTRDDGDEDVKFPVFRGTLGSDITFFGFDLTVEEALYAPYHETGEKADEGPDDHPDEGWFFCLQEPPAETRFGLDVGSNEDRAVPAGVTHASSSGGRTTETVARATAEQNDDFEHGWGALSWWHLVSDGTKPATVTHVDVDGSPPGAGDWAIEPETTWVNGLDATNPGSHDEDVYGANDAANWGRNAAHMARITWQRPVRVSIHADDMLPEGSRAGGTTVVDQLQPGVGPGLETAVEGLATSGGDGELPRVDIDPDSEGVSR
ncbi:hypothetical protein [Natrinema marinum]|uniref:hypothetical protein n=1 Tax=Natrinema marinum TaxID=2961598 RepID=UPI0020C8F38E|nr:hypothetical protein [Natrinema marinum]